jgi:K+-sensing histidine kinase KdpD
MPAARPGGETATRGYNELPVFLQSALIPQPETRDALRMTMRNQTSNLRNAAVRLFADSAAHWIVYFAMAVLSSVGVAIVAAELIARLLQAEPIATVMLCAAMFAAWFGGFGPALLAIALALLAFHYLLPPANSFAWKHNLLTAEISEIPRLILFSITSLPVAFVISAQREATETLRRYRLRRVYLRRERKLAVQCLLHHQVERPRNGALDLPLDRGSVRRTTVSIG